MSPTRDAILDILQATTGEREDADSLLHLIETQAYADGYMIGYKAGLESARVGKGGASTLSSE